MLIDLDQVLQDQKYFTENQTLTFYTLESHSRVKKRWTNKKLFYLYNKFINYKIKWVLLTFVALVTNIFIDNKDPDKNRVQNLNNSSIIAPIWALEILEIDR